MIQNGNPSTWKGADSLSVKVFSGSFPLPRFVRLRRRSHGRYRGIAPRDLAPRAARGAASLPRGARHRQRSLHRGLRRPTLAECAGGARAPSAGAEPKERRRLSPLSAASSRPQRRFSSGSSWPSPRPSSSRASCAGMPTSPMTTGSPSCSTLTAIGATPTSSRQILTAHARTGWSPGGRSLSGLGYGVGRARAPHPNGWDALFRIPYTALNFPGGRERDLGFQLLAHHAAAHRDRELDRLEATVRALEDLSRGRPDGPAGAPGSAAPQPHALCAGGGREAGEPFRHEPAGPSRTRLPLRRQLLDRGGSDRQHGLRRDRRPTHSSSTSGEPRSSFRKRGSSFCSGPRPSTSGPSTRRSPSSRERSV